jgi:hypothetical protein
VGEGTPIPAPHPVARLMLVPLPMSRLRVPNRRLRTPSACEPVGAESALAARGLVGAAGPRAQPSLLLAVLLLGCSTAAPEGAPAEDAAPLPDARQVQCRQDGDCGGGWRCVDGACFENCEEGSVRPCETSCGGGTRTCRDGVYRACVPPADGCADAGAPEERADGGALDASPGEVGAPVGARLWTPGGPLVGVTVLATDLEGELLGTARTDAEGRVRFDRAHGLTVIAPDRGPGSRLELISLLGVDPGEEWALPLPGEPEPDVVVRVAAPEPADGAAAHFVSFGCAEADLPPGEERAWELPARCALDDGAVHVLAVALDEAGRPLAYSPGRVAPDSDAPLRLPGWRVDWQVAALELASLPFGADRVELLASPVLGDVAFGLRGAQVVEARLGDGARGQLPIPRGFGEESVERQALVTFAQPQGLGWWRMRRADPAPISVDLAEVLPTRPVELSVGWEGPGRIRARWALDFEAAAADAQWLRLDWRVGERDHAWRVLAPPTPTSVPLPRLPDEHAARGPGEGPLVAAGLWRFACDAAEDYADVRARGCPHFSLQGEELPGATTYTYTSAQP